MILTKEQIDRASVRETVDVDVPEWGGSVRLRALSGADQVKVLGGSTPGATVNVEEAFRYTVNLLSLSIVGENGEPLFTAEEIGEKSAPVLNLLAEAATKLNAMGAAGMAAAVASLEPAPSVDSGSN